MDKKVTVFVEGNTHVAPTTEFNRAFAGVAEPENILQTAFNALFEPVISPLFIFEMKGGWKAALKRFAETQPAVPKTHLLLLLDYADRDSGTPSFSDAAEKKQRQLLPLVQEDIVNQRIPEYAYDFSENFDRIFFMIQKMEAWILSQPEVIERCFGALPEKERERFEQQKKRLFKSPASIIPNPDDVLKELLRYYSIERQGKSKKMEYKKVTHASQMLRQLDIHQLLRDFEDVRMMVEKVNSISIPTP
jgi:hypothetical protein